MKNLSQFTHFWEGLKFTWGFDKSYSHMVSIHNISHSHSESSPVAEFKLV